MISLFIIIISICLVYWLPAWAVPGLIVGLLWASFDLKKMAKKREECAGGRERR